METASKTLAPTKPEMEVVLRTWLAQGKESNSSSEDMSLYIRALELLEQSKDIPEFLAVLREQE